MRSSGTMPGSFIWRRGGGWGGRVEGGLGAGGGECLRPGAHGMLPGAQRRSAAALLPAMQRPAGDRAQRLQQLHAGWQQHPLLSRLGAADSAARINITSSWPRLRPTGSDSPQGKAASTPHQPSPTAQPAARAAQSAAAWTRAVHPTLPPRC